MQGYRPLCRLCNPTNYYTSNSTGYNRDHLCDRCIEGGYGIISFINQFELNTDNADLSTALQWMKEVKEAKERDERKMKEREERKTKEIKEKMDFLESYVDALQEGIHTDIALQPGSGPAIFAHKALLASKSEIFRTMLSNDECKAPAEDSISLPELTHDDLRCLLDFLYRGNLSVQENLTSNGSINERIISLFIAADKYEIPYLRRVCESRILQSVTPKNALMVLELASRCSCGPLREHALNSIVSYGNEVLLSAEYETFAVSNVRLCVEITRAMLKNTKVT